MANSIVFLGTGGTIAGVAKQAGDNLSYASGTLALADLLRDMPGLSPLLGDHAMVCEQVFQRDSKDLDAGHWALLSERVAHFLTQPQVAAVVITHGTDTLEESAYFLARTLEPALLARKPVVFTCAMRPATSLAPDGPQNVRDAVSVALHRGACGVVLVCQGEVHAALPLRKVHPYRLKAFDSGERGPLALVEEGAVRTLSPWSLALDFPALADLAALPAWPHSETGWPRVEIIWSHAGADGAMVRALCAAPPAGDAALAGLVVAGTGNGTLHHALEAALHQAQSQGIAVVRTTRCALGQVLARADGQGAGLAAWPLPAVKARVELMLQLRSKY